MMQEMIQKDLCENCAGLLLFVDFEHKRLIRSMIFIGELFLNITWKADFRGSGEAFFDHVQ